MRASDPWLSFAPNGDLYQISLSVTFSNPVTAVLVSKSTNGGDSWSEPIPLIRNPDRRFFIDKESITADPTDFHYVYAVWDQVQRTQGSAKDSENDRDAGVHAPAMFTRTSNAGQTWEAPRVMYDPGPHNSTIANQIVVQPDGTLVNFFGESVALPHSSKGNKFEFNLALVRSTDQGKTWGKVVRAAKETFKDVLDPDSNQPVRAESIIPEVAVDSHNGNLYAIWQDARFRTVDEIAFIMSTDDGDTWSMPIKVNQTPISTKALNQQAFIPAIHVAADGTIAVAYYDFRNNTPSTGLPTDYWIVFCRPAKTTPCTNKANWRQEKRLTPTSFNIEQAPATNGTSGFFLGDYQGLANSGNSFVAVFIQVNNGNSANQTDAFYASIMP